MCLKLDRDGPSITFLYAFDVGLFTKRTFIFNDLRALELVQGKSIMLSNSYFLIHLIYNPLSHLLIFVRDASFPSRHKFGVLKKAEPSMIYNNELHNWWSLIVHFFLAKTSHISCSCTCDSASNIRSLNTCHLDASKQLIVGNRKAH